MFLKDEWTFLSWPTFFKLFFENLDWKNNKSAEQNGTKIFNSLIKGAKVVYTQHIHYNQKGNQDFKPVQWKALSIIHECVSLAVLNLWEKGGMKAVILF